MTKTGKVTVTYKCGHTAEVEYTSIENKSHEEIAERIRCYDARHMCGQCLYDTRRYVLATVSIDDRPLKAYVIEGQNWNGWALPFFTKKQLPAYLEWQRTMYGYTVEFDEARDVVRTKWEDDEEWDEWPGEDIVIRGRRVHAYGVGAGSWCWFREEK